jgi:hypothetical protein
MNPPRTAIPPTVPPVIAPPLEELLLPELGELAVGLGGLVIVVAGVVVVELVVVELVVVAMVVELELDLGLGVAEIVNGVRLWLKMKPRVEALPRVKRLLVSSQHELFNPQQ